jgi:hypothetical protein
VSQSLGWRRGDDDDVIPQVLLGSGHRRAVSIQQRPEPRITLQPALDRIYETKHSRIQRDRHDGTRQNERVLRLIQHAKSHSGLTDDEGKLADLAQAGGDDERGSRGVWKRKSDKHAEQLKPGNGTSPAVKMIDGSVPVYADLGRARRRVAFFVDRLPVPTWVVGPENAAATGRDSRSLNFDLVQGLAYWLWPADGLDRLTIYLDLPDAVLDASQHHGGPPHFDATVDATTLTIRLLPSADAAMITGLGLAAGAALAVVLNRVMASALFGLVSFDATAVAVMTAAIGITVIVADWLPARRAASLEPTDALRMP